MSEKSKQFSFSVSEPGTRLDKYISEVCPELSRTRAAKLINDGLVSVSGRAEKASYKVSAGDEVQVWIPPEVSSTLAGEEIDIKILYEDNDILVVDKPAGLTVHPSSTQPRHTLVNAILSHLSSPGGEPERPGIVHRLDKDTSGVMVVARNPVAHEKLAAQFKHHTVKKVYITLVRGHLTPQQGIIEAPIGRDSGDRKKMTVTTESRGRKASTSYKVIRFVGDNTLLEVMPQTGRTHQIRVHLSAIGFPVVGDAAYGIKSSIISRQFLHAHKLGLINPSNGQYVEFVSPLPADLVQALETAS